jgi:triosephosphate isomerase (TIM)
MKPFIAANWKCNPTTEKEAVELFDSIKKEVGSENVVICPPFVYLSVLGGLPLGAQNIFFEKKGAYTGEISPLMAKDLGCEYVIIGHSERRKYFKETNEVVNKKIKAALEAGLTPIFCVGETEEERDRAEEVIEKQIREGLSEVSYPDSLELIIAYEPVWAIGTGNPCDAEEAKKMGMFIKKIAEEFSSNVLVLYGGSVNSSNSSDYIEKAQMSGLLVGGASLDKEEFVKIVKNK